MKKIHMPDNEIRKIKELSPIEQMEFIKQLRVRLEFTELLLGHFLPPLDMHHTGTSINILRINIKTQRQLVDAARRLKYLADEGFYDVATKGLPNHIAPVKVGLTARSRKILKPLGQKLAKLAGVSAAIAMNFCIQESLKERKKV